MQIFTKIYKRCRGVSCLNEASAMSDKKSINSWFMKNIILPNNEIIDKPGYVVYLLGSKKRNCHLREVFLPESVISGIESAFSKKYGKAGEKAVYSAGKLWGARFAITSGVPTRKTASDKDMLEFTEVLMRLLESEYTSGVEYSADLSKNLLEFRAKGLMVCGLSGLGHFLTGTLDGTWEHMMGVETEGAHISCRGRGGGECTIRCAPPENLGTDSFFRVKVPAGLGLEPDYFRMNKILKPGYARNSFRDLLEGKIVEYSGGSFRYGRSRLILNEASSVYFLEKELSRPRGGADLLYETAKEGFRGIVPKGTPPEKFLTDLIPAFGWGDIHFDASGSSVACIGYPWTSYAKETSFPIIRGIAAGILSSQGSRVDFREARASIGSGSLDLVLR